MIQNTSSQQNLLKIRSFSLTSHQFEGDMQNSFSTSYRVYQKWEVNLRSRSDTILDGTPCNLTFSLTYNWTNLAIDILRFTGKKWALFVSRSTITHVASWPWTDLGKWVTKSIAMLSHFLLRISNGCNNSPGLWCSTFAFWQVKHVTTYWVISLFIPDHQNDSFRSWCILVVPGCRLRWLLCLLQESFSLLIICRNTKYASEPQHPIDS